MSEKHEIDEELNTGCCEEHEHHHHHDHEHEHHHDHEHEHHHHHEHHHEHEHEHHHHEHEHHHHHDHDHEEHDENCTCGCHDHDHEHHHHHDHEHHHEHNHGTQYKVDGFKIFETHSHEGATICSFEREVSDKEAADVIASMENSIKTLESWLDNIDAMIGHVKGYVKEAGLTTTFSTVGNGLNVEKHEGGTILVGFASIVFGPSEEELKDKVVEIFG